MRTLKTRLPDMVAHAALERAWFTFRHGKSNRRSVRAFECHLERHLRDLQRDILGGTYAPGPYRVFFIEEPKRRLIAAASVRDRVVHHAVHQALAPALDRGLIDTTYACLPGRGTHRALLRFVQAMRAFRHVLMLDIRHYFLSVDLEILGGLMRARIRDPGIHDLLGVILASGEGLYSVPFVQEHLGLPTGFPGPGRGLPIGNLTSQWWGNHYLNGLDHFVKRMLNVAHYQRYMDL